MSTRITPDEPFPEDLGALAQPEVEVLNSKLHRELDHEYVHEGSPSPETESRLEEVTDELDFRDLAPDSASVQVDPAAVTSAQGSNGQDAQSRA
ncbi:hypothetical protein ACX80U_11795 [Arthrobacter sp. TmT3-37]